METIAVSQEVFWTALTDRMKIAGYPFEELGFNNRLMQQISEQILFNQRMGISEKVEVLMEKIVKPFFFYKRQFEELKRTKTPEECGKALVENWTEFFGASSTKPFAARGKTWSVSCKEGCSACCHLQVTLSEAEAKYLLAYAREKGIEIDKERLDAQRRPNNANEWIKLRWSKSRCVFLGEGNRCQVYEARPLACRAHASVQEPKLCDYREHPNGQVAYFSDISSEVFISAAGFVFPQDRNMARWLWKLTLV